MSAGQETPGQAAVTCVCGHRDHEHSNIKSGECLVGGCGCTRFEVPVHLVQMWLCDLCFNGAGGECHSPGCALWINRAPDIPLRLSAFVKVLPRPEEADGIQVTVTDLDSGDTETQVIHDDYVLTCAGACYLDGVQSYANGTHVLTVKGRKQ